MSASAYTESVHADALVRSATGPNATDIQSAVDTFRNDIGGGSVPGSNGGFGAPVVRREINWDGVPDVSAAPNPLALNFFNTSSPRGVVFATPGSSIQVSADSSNPTSTPIEFGNINANYPTAFGAFSPERLFTPIGSNVVDIDFFIPGTATPALVSAFGAVFSDVDSNTSTSLEFFDANEVSLGKFLVPGTSGTSTFSFLGVSFTGAPSVSRVRVTSGTGALGADENVGAGSDLVVLDDFIYSEPTSGSASNNIAVLSPNGGDVVAIGATLAVNWTPGVTGGAVKIELSRNAGLTWETLNGSTADDGAQSFTTTGPATAQALVRVSSLTDVTKTDVSNSVFTIGDPTCPSGQNNLADLTVSFGRVRFQGGQARGTLTVTNSGAAATGPFVVDLYLSNNRTVSGGDTLLNRLTVSGLAAGQSVNLSIRPRITARRGRFNIVAFADGTGVIEETDESNNIASASINTSTRSNRNRRR